MAMRRTTLMLDEESRHAARELALRYDCSMSEAVRRAIVQQRDAAAGLSPARQATRRQAFAELVELFDGHDAEEEVRRLKAEDEGF